MVSLIGDIAKGNRSNGNRGQSSKAQRDALVKQFRDITHATFDDALRLLKACRYASPMTPRQANKFRWSMDHAMEAFWNDPSAQRNAERSALSSTASYGPKLEALFDQYASLPGNDDKDNWGIDATLKWCEDLGFDPEDPVMLSVAHMCKAKEMGSFQRTEWVNAWKLARKDSIATQRSHIETLRADLLHAPATFRKIYTYAFDYARDQAQRSLALETACALWDMLLPIAPASLLEAESAWSWSRNPTAASKWLGWWKEFLADPQGGKGRPICELAHLGVN
jgi:DCN1-like protein 1/2